MKKILALFLTFSILALTGNLYAKERKGTELVIHKKDGKEVKGELIVVKENSLLIMESLSGADVSVSFRDISVLRIVKKSKALTWGGFGFLLGALAGYGGNASSGFMAPTDYAAAVGVGIFGFLIGAGFGAIAGGDEVIKLEGLPMSGIKERMYGLRKETRVPDYN